MEHRDYRDQQGQLPPEIYRRRRIVAVAVIVVVLALIVWGIVAAVNKGGKKNSSTAGSSTVTVSSTATVTEKPSNAPDCAAGALKIEAQVGRPNVAQGNNLPLIMKITNTSKKACKAELGAAHQRYEVYTMKANRPVWKSEICYTSAENRKEVLDPGETRRFTVNWEGTRQNADGNCSAQAAPAGPGAYKLYTLLNAQMGEPATFNVVPAGEDDTAVAENDEDTATTPSTSATTKKSTQKRTTQKSTRGAQPAH